jgi:hypothetical protein
MRQFPDHGPRRHVTLDVVELLLDSRRWPAGTIGTVVEANDDQALIEIGDERGHALDFVTLPHDALGPPPDQAADRFAS